MNKIASALALVVLLIVPVVIAGAGSLDFQVEIVMDTTISLPTMCENENSSIAGVLEFSPGIDGISSDNARPDDSCANATTLGDYNVSNDGNVYLNISFRLNNSAPQGITIGVGNQSAYVASFYAALNNVTDLTPIWSAYLPPTGSDVVNIWQRVGADDTATGDTAFNNTIIVTSQKS